MGLFQAMPEHQLKFFNGVDGLLLHLQYVVMGSSFDDTALTGLVAGRDYPRTYHEFVEMFPDDAACAAWLEPLRWPSGFVCTKRGTAADPWRHSRGRLACSSCRYQRTVTAGTILDKTRTPLTSWFEAARHVTAAKNGLLRRHLSEHLASSTGWRRSCFNGSEWQWCAPNANGSPARSKLMRPLSAAWDVAASVVAVVPDRWWLSPLRCSSPSASAA